MQVFTDPGPPFVVRFEESAFTDDDLRRGKFIPEEIWAEFRIAGVRDQRDFK